MVTVESIVEKINCYTSDVRYKNFNTGGYISINTNVWIFGKNIAKKLNAIEECFCNDYILLKRNNIYIKITWEDFPDDGYIMIDIDGFSSSEWHNQ